MSNKLTTLTTFALRKLWTLIAVALVVFALLISALRYSLPLLDDRKELIENYVQTEYGLDLAIGSIAADWQPAGPSLVLNNVVMRQGENSPVTLNVGELKLLIDFWPSLFQRKLQSKNVQLSELDLQLNLDRMSNGNGDIPIVQVLESVFLEQLAKFSVEQSQLTVKSKNNQQTIKIDQLSWLNKEQRHQGWGLLSLDTFATKSITFVIDLNGDVDDYSGTFYSQGEALDISPWLNEFIEVDSTLVASNTNFSFWANIQDGQITRIHSEIEPSVLQWGKTSEKSVTNGFSGQLVAINQPDGWHFTLNDFDVSVEQETLPLEVSGLFTKEHELFVQTSALDDIQKLLPAMKVVSVETFEKLTALSPQLSLGKVQVALTKQGNFIQMPEVTLSTAEYNLMPGIENLQLGIAWWNKQGKIQIQQSSLQLYSERLFNHDKLLEDLNLDLYIEKLPEGVFLNAENLSVIFDGLAIDADMAYASQNNFLSLKIHTGDLPANRVKAFLPNELMGQGTINYLTRALNGPGEIAQANLIWHGNTSQFPFTNNNGIFHAGVDIENADFRFAPDWPELKQLNIRLDFLNKALVMNSPEAMLGEVKISNIEAIIPQLTKGATLKIDANGIGSGEQLASLMSDSSLADSLGRILTEQVIVSGNLTTDLQLNIPLDFSGRVQAIGEVDLLGNQVNIEALGLSLKNAEGTLAFDNQDLKVDGVNAELFGQPITLDLASKQLDNYALDIEIGGNWQLEELTKAYVPGLTEQLTGAADFTLALNIILNKEDYQYDAQLRSQLVDVNSSLPFPLDKTSGQTMPLAILASGDNIASSVQMTLGNDVRFEGTLPHKEKKFNRAHLAFGQTDFFGMGVGFSISANLPEMDAQLWVSNVKRLFQGVESTESAFIGVPQRIFVETEQLIIGNNQVTDVGLIARRNLQDWSIDVEADQVRGNIVIHDEWTVKGIEANMDYIKLESYEQEPESQLANFDYEPTDFPTLNINCKECAFGQYKLGKVELEASPNNDGLRVEQLLIEGENGRVNAEGQWYKRHLDHYTFFAGDFRSNDFGRSLQNFGANTGIRDSEANIEFALTWQKSPFEFNFDSLGGEINWQLTDGYLNEVSDQGSRIFTLLSLNSLVRKLSLDFRDVFAKGFFYDSMQGSILLTDGKADTRDTVIDGAAGEIEIYGYTDLVTKELNYNVSFAPNVTGNLPVLVYFFTVSPPSVLAALAIDQMLTSTKVISNVNYSVTGTIEEPILIETGRESTEVELPTRRLPEAEETQTPFVPPTTDELIEVQQDG
ncbi:YhdP family protein [Glaciecola sp. 1036]|uniref:YhdP family protein n=1 Tax=Alteromonadaceae TaxID=72275 RepID=UPI003D069F5A